MKQPLSAYGAGKLLGHLSRGHWRPMLLMLGGMTLMRLGARMREHRLQRQADRRRIKASR